MNFVDLTDDHTEKIRIPLALHKQHEYLRMCLKVNIICFRKVLSC